MKIFAAGLKFFTIWNRLSLRRTDLLLVGAAAAYFPIIGLVQGLTLALLSRTLDNYVDSELLSIVLVTVLIILTGGSHLEGLQRTFDAITTDPLSTTTNSLKAAVGTVAILIVLLFKIKSLDILDDKLTVGLLVAPAFARWTLLVFIYGSYRHCEGELRIIAQSVRFWHLAVASCVMLGFATYWLGRSGLWIALCLSLLALICRRLWQARAGVLTVNNLGAVVELSEALSLTLLASI
jgi:adenosylcobinamide-GDP ribazoletransferase